MVRKSVTTLGLISDTHGKLPDNALGTLIESDVSLIAHAGDIGNPSILHELETIAPVVAVLGNNDMNEYGSLVGRFAHFDIEGVRFMMAHKPTDVRIGFNGGPGISPGDPLPNVLIHGHTHVPKIVCGKEVYPADVLVNPGAILRPRSELGRTLGFIDIEKGQVSAIRITTLDGKVLMEKQLAW